MSHCYVGVCSTPEHCKEIERCYSTPKPKLQKEFDAMRTELDSLRAIVRELVTAEGTWLGINWSPDSTRYNRALAAARAYMDTHK